MTIFVALLRAVNVGGTGGLAMADLKALCSAAGFANVRTYIASGNVVFESALPDLRAKSRLEAALAAHAGKPIDVLIRTAADMAAIVAANPFPAAPANRTMAIFLNDPPPADVLAGVSHQTDEQIRLGRREIYVYYPQGAGASKLRMPGARLGTARNMNTVATLARMATA
jgi:uncharacterized protein (DUF1697 family)